jgi:hypothetical protein
MAIASAASGCKREEKLSLSGVPLAKGVRPRDQAYGCPVTPDVCFRWAILEGTSRSHARGVKEAERQTLARRGWHLRPGTSRQAVAADSPDGDLFISFETGAEQLAEVRRGDSAWGNHELAQKLRRLVSQHRPVLAITLENGKSSSGR